MELVCINQDYPHAKFLTRNFHTVSETEILDQHNHIRPECLFDPIQDNKFVGPDYEQIKQFCYDHNINLGNVVYSTIEPNEIINLDELLNDICWPEAN